MTAPILWALNKNICCCKSRVIDNSQSYWKEKISFHVTMNFIYKVDIATTMGPAIFECHSQNSLLWVIQDPSCQLPLVFFFTCAFTLKVYNIHHFPFMDYVMLCCLNWNSMYLSNTQASLSFRCSGSLYLAWAVWEGRLIWSASYLYKKVGWLFLNILL